MISSPSVDNKEITLIVDGFGSGGIQQAYIVLINEYQRSYEHVNLIILATSSKEIPISNTPKLTVFRLNARNFFDLKTFCKFSRLCSHLVPQTFIASIYRAQIWSAFAKPKNSKLIWVEHNTYLKRSKIQWLIMRLLAIKVNKIVAVSNDVRRITESRLKKTVTVIPNPTTFSTTINLKQVRKNDFIFIGRLVHQKNPELVLESFYEFHEKYNTNSLLHIVGSGELLNKMGLLTDRLGLQKHCIFHHSVDIQGVKNLLLDVKTLVSTSIIEGMGIVRLEAFASGCCVVTTNTGGTDLFSSLTNHGLFVAGSDKVDIAKQMYESISQKYWTADQIMVRQSIIKDFNPKTISKNLVSL